MKLPRDEFKKLQQHWYKKLADSGFKDIERLKDNDLVLEQRADGFYRNIDEFSRGMQEEYFRQLALMALDEDTVYRNETDRYIMVRYSEGAKIKVITGELERLDMARHRHSIKFIIRRYEMQWGLRKYDAKQLNVKKKA